MNQVLNIDGPTGLLFRQPFRQLLSSFKLQLALLNLISQLFLLPHTLVVLLHQQVDFIVDLLQLSLLPAQQCLLFFHLVPEHSQLSTHRLRLLIDDGVFVHALDPHLQELSSIAAVGHHVIIELLLADDLFLQLGHSFVVDGVLIIQFDVLDESHHVLQQVLLAHLEVVLLLLTDLSGLVGVVYHLSTALDDVVPEENHHSCAYCLNGVGHGCEGTDLL